ncbi:MAG: hypothetical protein ACKV0T_15875 [Planctomycetales bacterium]
METVRLVVKQSPEGHDRLGEFLSVLLANANGDAPGLLIVHQNRRVQDQIEQLLTRLDARSD